MIQKKRQPKFEIVAKRKNCYSKIKILKREIQRIRKKWKKQERDEKEEQEIEEEVWQLIEKFNTEKVVIVSFCSC